MYPSCNSAPRCQRCGASLALNDPRCPNCRYINHFGQNAPQQQQKPAAPSWNSYDGQHEQNPLFHQQGPQPSGSLLKRYSAQQEQRNSYRQPYSSAPQSQPARQPVPPRASLNTTPSQGWQQLSPSAYAQAPQVFYQEAEKRRQFGAGRFIGVLVLLGLVIGGGFFAYTSLLPHKQMQQVTQNATSRQPSTPVATSQGTPLFQDEFTNNANGWSIQSYPGEFSVALGNGTLKLENDNNKLLWELIPSNKTYGDFQLSVDAVLSKGSQDNGYGVYIRSTLSPNASITTFYRFELYGDGSFAIFKGTTDANGMETTSRLTDYTNNSAIQKQGSLNHITVSAKGSSLQFIVNGQTLSTVSDATYTSGSVALFVSNLQKATPGAIATFSHLAIYAAKQ